MHLDILPNVKLNEAQQYLKIFYLFIVKDIRIRYLVNWFSVIDAFEGIGHKTGGGGGGECACS